MPPEESKTMTPETRHVQIADIKGIRITCQNEKCGCTLVMNPASDLQMPTTCIVCKTAFGPEGVWSLAHNLHNAVRGLVKANAENVHVEIAEMGHSS